mmetsp:Transcript_40699/g.80204  ORF Transcript_40699/g.80204 Transcript_40699/m.80204 type:complete len:92 (+) Transcript_40699:121-396(+)
MNVQTKTKEVKRKGMDDKERKEGKKSSQTPHTGFPSLQIEQRKEWGRQRGKTKRKAAPFLSLRQQPHVVPFLCKCRRKGGMAAGKGNMRGD